MRALHLSPHERGAIEARIVLLPGAQQRPEDFIAAGFAHALHERNLPLELILAEPQMTHVTDRSWLPRLRDEIVRPARLDGQPIWLGGISLGAFQALRFAAEPACGIDGLCLLAPYLGSRIIAAEIARHGTLEAWHPGKLAEDDDERHIWRYVRGLARSHTRVFLGLGRQDRFADTQRLLARALPAGSCVTVEGGHEWPVWRQLWDNFLERQRAADAAAPSQPSP